MTVEQWHAMIASADARISRQALALFAEYTRDMLEYARSIEHVQSGDMRDSTVALGPFPIGNGALESTIFSGAWYSEQEAAKGGAHDWPTRTVEEQQARLLQLQLEVEAAAAAILTGGS